MRSGTVPLEGDERGAKPDVALPRKPSRWGDARMPVASEPPAVTATGGATSCSHPVLSLSPNPCSDPLGVA